MIENMKRYATIILVCFSLLCLFPKSVIANCAPMCDICEYCVIDTCYDKSAGTDCGNCKECDGAGSCDSICSSGEDCCNDDICCDSGDVCCTDSGSYCCPSGKTCCEGTCCESAQTCCNGTCCEPPVISSISGPDSVELCENAIFTAIASDPDGTTLSYNWSGGGDPATGSSSTFTTKWSVLGVKSIHLVVTDNDNDECCGTAPCCDDKSSDIERKDVTVNLPGGCSVCGSPASVPPSVSESGGCGYCNGAYGVVTVFNNTSDHTYASKTPCYDNSDWYAQLDTVDSKVYICRNCPSNPATVSCMGDVSGMTKAQACTQYGKYPNDPLLISDMFTTSFENDCWCRDCVAVHEEEHMNKDWKEDSVQQEVTSFKNWSAGHAINIDCSDSDSTNCNTSLTAAEKAAYDFEWNARVTAAWNTFGAQSEGDAEAAERDCYQDIIDALYTKCNTP